jgi:DNA-binding NtrC family response regulator
VGFQILIIEDDPLLAKYLSEIVSHHHRCFVAHDLQSAQKALETITPDLVFTDLNLSSHSQLEGLEVVSLCKSKNIPAIILTSHGEDKIISEAFMRGCSHYILKDEFETEVEMLIKKMLGAPSENFLKQNFITASSAFKAQIQFILDRSNDQIPLLFTGETGVGKTHLAQIIHNFNDENRPFIAKNLSELSQQVIESELFGHKKGSFTGAHEDRKGWIEQANGGTLFLDEIGALSLNTQQKLLKVIEEKMITPVGSSEPIKVDFRLMTATCENLQEKIENGEFRIDFYFRIKGLETHIPPLRQRPEDIDYFIKEVNRDKKKKIFLTDEAVTLLKNYPWPGNIRELRSTLNSLHSASSSLITENELLPLMKPLKETQSSAEESDLLLTPKVNSDILTHGLSEALKKIETEAFHKLVQLYGMKPNKICDTLKISKSVFYRLQSQWETIYG